MEYYDTYDEEGNFQSSEDEYDVHYKGLWHKVIRIWLYDNEGNLFLRVRKEDQKLDCINKVHILSDESISSCFDRAMFEKLGIHFPATSNFEMASQRKVKIHKVYSDNSELKENYFLCDYIGEFNDEIKFLMFGDDTSGLVKVNAKGVLGLLNKRTGEILGYNILPSEKDNEKTFIQVGNIYEDPNEDTYMKYSYVVSSITNNVNKHKKEEAENEKLKKLVKKQDEEFVSHADENEGDEIY